MKKFLFFLLYLNGILVFGQKKEIFIFPMEVDPLLSATFGELRPNHFHAGLDIKTNGQTGIPVRAVADGYVYRIKVQRGGYGKALYIKHPDGLISVYGHLDKFAGDLEDYVKRHQYDKRRFFVELFPGESLFPVKKGQIVAYSGNTGSSMGPHLHFEIREGESYPVNPMLYGFVVEDTIAPLIRNLYAYALNDTSSVNNSQNRVKVVLNSSSGKIVRAMPVWAYGEIGLGIDAYDQANGTYNKNGIYKVEMWVNGLKVYETRMDKISFSTTRNINVLIDYPYYVRSRRYIQRLWKHPEARLPVFSTLVNKGKIFVEDGKTYLIKIVLSDFNDNSREIYFQINGKKPQTIDRKKELKTPFYVNYKKPFSIHGNYTDVFFPAGSFYENQYIKFSEYTNGFEILPDNIPLRKNIKVRYSLERVPGSMKKYAYLAKVNPKSKRSYFVTANKKHDSIVLKTRSLGTYFIQYDSIAPTIYDLNIKNNKWVTHFRFLRFKVKDKTGIKSVEAYIDGKWILVEWDYKTGRAFYNFNDLKFPGTKHSLRIVVTDRVGNVKEKNLIFYRKFK